MSAEAFPGRRGRVVPTSWRRDPKALPVARMAWLRYDGAAVGAGPTTLLAGPPEGVINRIDMITHWQSTSFLTVWGFKDSVGAGQNGGDWVNPGANGYSHYRGPFWQPGDATAGAYDLTIQAFGAAGTNAWATAHYLQFSSRRDAFAYEHLTNARMRAFAFGTVGTAVLGPGEEPGQSRAVDMISIANVSLATRRHQLSFQPVLTNVIFWDKSMPNATGEQIPGPFYPPGSTDAGELVQVMATRLGGAATTGSHVTGHWREWSG